MIDKLPKVTPKPGTAPEGVEAVAHGALKSTDLLVLFSDDLTSENVCHFRRLMENRGFKVGVIAMGVDDDIAVLDRKAQEQLYKYLGQLLGK